MDNVNQKCKGPLIYMTKWFGIQYSTSHTLLLKIFKVYNE